MAQRRYSPEEKQHAVSVALSMLSRPGTTRNTAISNAADETGVNPGTLRSWMRGKPGPQEQSTTHVSDPEPAPDDTAATGSDITGVVGPDREEQNHCRCEATGGLKRRYGHGWHRLVIDHDRDTLPTALLTAHTWYLHPELYEDPKPLQEMSNDELIDRVHGRDRLIEVFVDALALIADDYIVQ